MNSIFLHRFVRRGLIHLCMLSDPVLVFVEVVVGVPLLLLPC